MPASLFSCFECWCTANCECTYTLRSPAHTPCQVCVAMRALNDKVLHALALQAADATLSDKLRNDAYNLRTYLKLLQEAFPGCLVPKGRKARISNAQDDLAGARRLYEFCRDWINHLETAGEVNTKTKKFIAWQTYENLRFMFFGFEEFCTSYLADHPGNYLVVRSSVSTILLVPTAGSPAHPSTCRRWSLQPGLSATSGLESTFSHAKSLGNGTLLACNFAGVLCRIGVLKSVGLGAVRKGVDGRWHLQARVEARSKKT